MLIKDVGEIPYQLHKLFGWNTKIVSYKMENEYPFLHNEVQGLDLEFIPNTGSYKYFDKSYFGYIWKNAKNIDVLNLYHYEPPTFIYGILYKILNPKGFLYVKLDNDIRSLEKVGTMYKFGNPIISLLFKPIQFLFHTVTNLFTIETTKGYEMICDKYPRIKNKLQYMPNGLDVEQIQSVYDFTKINSSKKKNNIITICRVGTIQKNISLLLQAIQEVDIKDWTFTIIGPIEESFKAEINEFYEKNPQLRDVVTFTGPIEDRSKIYKLLAESKVFCLPSRWESFCLVFIEAMLFGCHVIATNVISAPDILTPESSTIIPIDDKEVLTYALQQAINNEVTLPKLEKNIEHINKNFNWPTITKQLVSWFEKYGLRIN